MSGEWVTVKKKERKPPAPGDPVKSGCSRLLTKSDYTLTEAEKQTLRDIKFKYFCVCCQSHGISAILGRKVHSCYTCYCCTMGDYPFGCDCEVWLDDGVPSVRIIPKSSEEYGEYDDYHFQKYRKR